MRVSPLATFVVISLSGLALASSCKADNCLNAMSNHPSSASAFCTPYLATTQTATSGIPSFLANCKADTSRLSSACSCILLTSTATSPIPSASCTATTTITALASTVTTTLTSGPTCPSIEATNTITSVSISTIVESSSTCPSTRTANTVTSVSVSTTTITVTATATATALPSCFPRIVGGDFTSNSADLNAFTVTQTPGYSILNEVLATGAQEFLSVTDGTSQFLFLNYELLPIPSQYTLAQYVGPVCSPYTSITLSATINADFDGGTITFCINPTTCSNPQDVSASNGSFLAYYASFEVTPDVAVTASMNLAVDDSPEYFAGIGIFQIIPA